MYAALDIGGTKTLVAVFDENQNIVEQHKFPTNPDYELFKIDLAKAVAELSTPNFLAGGIGMRGNIDRENGYSLLDDILPWGKVPLKKDCEDIFKCPFSLENDSKLAGLSEAIAAGKTYKKVLYITVSTGIGSAFIVNGSIDDNTKNSEIGKWLFEHDGKLQSWEDFAGGKAIVAKYNMRASEIDSLDTWKDISKNLSIGFINAAAAFTPDLIIIGGGVGTHYEKFRKPLLESIHEIKPEEINFPEIKQAQRPEEAVVFGCYELAKHHEHKPTN